MTGSGSTVTVITPTSTLVGMLPPISEVLFTAMEAAVKTNHFDTDQAGYARAAQRMINQNLRCKKMSNEIESLQIQLHVTQWAAAQANPTLNHVQASWWDREVAHLEAGFSFRDAPIFDSKPKELKSWVLYLRTKLGAQPTIYTNLITQVKYAFNRLVRDSLDQG